MDEDSNPPDAVINTTGVDAAIRTQGIQWTNTNEGRIRAENWSGEVHISLAQGEGKETEASVSAYFEAQTAREITESLRSSREGVWETGECTMWIDRGWLRHEGPSRSEEGHNGIVSISTDSAGVSVEFVYEGRKEGDVVKTNTNLSDVERDRLIAALEFASSQAEQYDPIDTTATTDPSNSRLQRFIRAAIPAGITLAIGYGITSILHSKLEKSGMTINGEPVNIAPSPEAFVFLAGLVMFIAWSIQYLPGTVRGGIR